jgi:hypothetical protein
VTRDPTEPTPVSSTTQEPGTVTEADLELLDREVIAAQERLEQLRRSYDRSNVPSGPGSSSQENPANQAQALIDAEAALANAMDRRAAALEALNTQGGRSDGDRPGLRAIQTERTGEPPEDNNTMVFTPEEVDAENAGLTTVSPSTEEETEQARIDRTAIESRSVPFVELSNQALYQDYQVFINGLNVTRWVTGSVSVTQAGRGGTNTAAFQLVNPDNLFVLIPNREAGGSVGGNIPPTTSSQESLSPTDLTFRTGERSAVQENHPMYSEIVKQGTYLLKATSPLQIGETIGVTDQRSVRRAQAGTPDPASGGTRNALLATRPGDNPRDEAGYDIPNLERWPFGYHRAVFHKNDPVRIFVHNPFTPSRDGWICAFTGYIQTYPIDDDWIMGNSTISVACYCLKALMQKMRFQTNQVVHELPGTVAVDEGFFADFLREQEGGQAQNRLANKPYEDIMAYILTGRFLEDWFDGYLPSDNVNHALAASEAARRRMSTIGLPVTFHNPTDDVSDPASRFDVPADEGQQLRARVTERTTNGVGQMAMGSIFRFPGALTSNRDKANFIEEWHKLGLYGGFRRPLTYREVLWIGSETSVTGQCPPDRAYVHMLVPSRGSGQGTLEQVGIDQESREGLREYATRYDLADGYSEKIDFQWWTNGMGNIMVEMPMYDWFPSDFDEWATVFTVDKHAISSNVGDESGDPPTAIIVRGSHTGDVNISEEDLAAWTPHLGIAWAPSMIHRYGLTQAEVNLPFVTDPAILRARALLEMQKRLAEANQLSADFIFRPLLTPNRPLYFAPRERIGWVQSVTNSLAVLGECTTSVELNYARHRDINGRWRHITGGSFSALRYGQVVTSEEDFLPNVGNTAPAGGNAQGAAGVSIGAGVDVGTIQAQRDNVRDFPVTCNSGIEYTTPNRGEDSCQTRPNSPTRRQQASEDVEDPAPDQVPRASDDDEPEEPEEATRLCLQATGPDDAGAFAQAARAVSRAIEGEHLGWFDADELRTHIEEQDDDTVERLLIFAHGSPRWIGEGRNSGAGRPRGRGISMYYQRDFFPDVMRLETFVEIAAPKLVDNAIVGLCACSCGRNPDPRPSSADSRLSGGGDSFAYHMQAAFARAGKTVQVRAHSRRGHTTANAACRLFTGGSVGVSIAEQTWGEEIILYPRRLEVGGTTYPNGAASWARGQQRVDSNGRRVRSGGRVLEGGAFWGDPAQRWVSGEPVDQEVIDLRPILPT